eukprot:4083962-Ditylum_brightwellii.AAC.1
MATILWFLFIGGCIGFGGFVAVAMASLALAKCLFVAQLIVVFALAKTLLVGWKVVSSRPMPLRFLLVVKM